MMQNKPINPPMSDAEKTIHEVDKRIENLKVQYNLFFSGELDVPPDTEREAVEKKIKSLLFTGQKAARLNLLLQNISSKFALYNNMWLKKLNDLETGVVTIKRKKAASSAEPDQSWNVKVYGISLNDEQSFENLYKKYCELFPKASAEIPLKKENLIHSIKAKMISSSMVDAKAAISVAQGKLKIKIKK